LTFGTKCGIIIMSRGEENKNVPLMALSNGAKSVFGVCVFTLQGSKKIFQKLLENLLTKPQKCGIIIMSRGEGATKFCECLGQKSDDAVVNGK
jgi:hypothetical protein